MNKYAFLTDQYELTMLNAALNDGRHETRSVFELFARKLPGDRRYGVVAGVGRALETVQDFRFDADDLKYLADNKIVDSKTLKYLENYEFKGNITGLQEGDLYFPNTPLLQVEGSFAECVVLETVLLSIYNYDSAIATAASRMRNAAENRGLAEMGSRRANENAAVAAARAAYIAGFDSTSNVEAGRQYNIPTVGTSAHAFTLLYENELDAFRSQLASLGINTTLLVDTYDTLRGIKYAVQAAQEIAKSGEQLGSIRLDSGDLLSLAEKARNLLDSLGSEQTKIIVTNDLDEFSIAALQAKPIDSYGVGTSLVTGSGVPTCQMVYKMVAREGSDGSMIPVQKLSASKKSVGGHKQVYRGFDAKNKINSEKIFVSENGFVHIHDTLQSQNLENHTHTLMQNGTPNSEYISKQGVINAKNRHKTELAKYPESITRLSSGSAYITPEFISVG
ncbi:MAG: nicotinate phosphoribosyltransferase [Bifidobacteriaceae bacterium]|jgi:nicotinate phosphoribosyltransferase|nr:nicotinate phosphoribosyltransferase [Bifidobacteriaceae bacterium]